MNQISGKIARFFYVGHDPHFYIHCRGRKANNRAGGLCMNFSGAKWNNPSLIKSYIASFPTQTYPPQPIEYPTIPVYYIRHFYSNWRNKLRTARPYIMKSDEIPFEFLLQPALPGFDHLAATQDNNLSFQQTLSKDI